MNTITIKDLGKIEDKDIECTIEGDITEHNFTKFINKDIEMIHSFSASQVEKYSFLPQIGDIILGEMASIQSYGYFIDIATLGIAKCNNISALMHNSKIDHNHIFSISNPQSIKKFGQEARKVYVEVIEKNEKGYLIKESYDTFNYSIKDATNFKILFQETYFTYEDSYDSLNEDSNTKVIQRKPLDEKNITYYKKVIVCNDDIYYLIPLVGIKYFSEKIFVYMSKDYKIITTVNGNSFKFHEAETPLFYNNREIHSHSGILLTNKEIEEYNENKLDEVNKSSGVAT